MKYWTGEIVYKHDWTVHSENHTTMPEIYFEWNAKETQSWKLTSIPIADIKDPTAFIHDASWTITGSGNRIQRQDQDVWTAKWTINGRNTWPIKISIKELSNHIWRVDPTANGQNAVDVIDKEETPPTGKTQKSKGNRFELNIPTIAVEKSARIIAKLTGGKSGAVTGPSGFQRWSLVPEPLRDSLSGWIIHDIPVPYTDPVGQGVDDPEVGSKTDKPWVATRTGSCTWSWRLEERD